MVLLTVNLQLQKFSQNVKLHNQIHHYLSIKFLFQRAEIF